MSINNKSNLLIDKYNLKINNFFCKYYLQKNGKMIFLPKNHYKYFCMINDIGIIDFIDFKYLENIDEEIILKKILILYVLGQKKFKYLKIKNNYKSSKKIKNNYDYLLFHESKLNIVIKFLFHFYIINNDKNMYNFYNSTNIRKLSTQFMIYKLMFNKTNKTTLIKLFYTLYIKLIENEIYKKYNKKYSDFENYKKLYIFLKKKGYVDKFYNNYSNKIIKNYNKYYNKIADHYEFKNYEKKAKIFIKDLKDLNFTKIIDQYIDKNYNKIYIKNKFNKIIKNINISNNLK